MNTVHASSFLFSGLVLWLLPAIAPGLFLRLSIDGSSARELWVQIMAVVNASVGVIGILQHAVLPWLSALPAAAAAWRQQPVPAGALRVGAGAEALYSEQTALFARGRVETDAVR